MSKSKKLEVEGRAVSILIDNDKEYISLTNE